jgi:undecaprenyl-diphosphatase
VVEPAYDHGVTAPTAKLPDADAEPLAPSPIVVALPDVAAGPVAEFDRAVDGWFDRLRGNAVADRVFYSASAIGDYSMLWHLLSLGRAVARPRTEREALRLATALAVESVAVNVGIKSLFRRDRPAWEQDRPRNLRQPRSSSFPSGHATSAFMAATLLSQGRPKQRPLWYGLAAVVAASRVHVRIHHASDVVGGAALGVIAGKAVGRGWRVGNASTRRRG